MKNVGVIEGNEPLFDASPHYFAPGGPGKSLHAVGRLATKEVEDGYIDRIRLVQGEVVELRPRKKALEDGAIPERNKKAAYANSSKPCRMIREMSGASGNRLITFRLPCVPSPQDHSKSRFPAEQERRMAWQGDVEEC